MNSHRQRVLLTGATGFIGGRLLLALDKDAVPVRCLVRSPERFKPPPGLVRSPEVVQGDLLDAGSLEKAMESIDSAFYLVHSMGGRTIGERAEFAARDRRAAENFVRAAEKTGMKRVIYLGGLGETGDGLSEHLSSRQEVAQILQSGSVKTTVLRAAVIIGAGGASFEILRYLAERLPVMVAPKWIDTKSQPIAVYNVIEYLAGCLRVPETAGLTLDIGGVNIVTYREMMKIYARVRGLKRVIITVPVLTPRLSSYWINLITPVPSGIVMPLVEGLKNEVICRDNRIRDLVPLRLLTIEEAICNALAEAAEGPGKLPSQQACFFGGTDTTRSS